jgi:hypothetical protein
MFKPILVFYKNQPLIMYCKHPPRYVYATTTPVTVRRDNVSGMNIAASPCCDHCFQEKNDLQTVLYSSSLTNVCSTCIRLYYRTCSTCTVLLGVPQSLLPLHSNQMQCAPCSTLGCCFECGRRGILNTLTCVQVQTSNENAQQTIQSVSLCSLCWNHSNRFFPCSVSDCAVLTDGINLDHFPKPQHRARNRRCQQCVHYKRYPTCGHCKQSDTSSLTTYKVHCHTDDEDDEDVHPSTGFRLDVKTPTTSLCCTCASDTTQFRRCANSRCSTLVDQSKFQWLFDTTTSAEIDHLCFECYKMSMELNMQNDVIDDWLMERCEFDSLYSESPTHLYRHMKAWAKSTTTSVRMQKRAFFEHLDSLGFLTVSRAGMEFYIGLQLK